MIPETIYNRLDRRQREFINKFFSQCPQTLSAGMMLKTYPANHTLINADDSCTYVYFLLRGRLQGIEEHAKNGPYNFTEIKAIDIVGDYELFTESAARIVTLTTLEESLFLILPATDYIAWIKKDANALFIRTQMVIRQLVAQSQFERHNFFLDNRTRLLHFLANEYGRINRAPEQVRLPHTRPEMADKLGCSVRTVNRAINQLLEENFISLDHGKIAMSYDQYLTAKAALQKSRLTGIIQAY